MLSCADTLSAEGRQMFSPLGLFLPFFQPVQENPLATAFIRAVIHEDGLISPPFPAGQ